MKHDQFVHQVATDVYRVELPLPFALSSVNSYLLRGDAGWSIVDSGLNLPQAQARWQAAFQSLQIHPADIQQIILTHFHPDHYGMAGWLQTFVQEATLSHVPPVRMAPREAELARMVWHLPPDAPEPLVAFFGAQGVPAPLNQAMAEGVARLRAMTRPHPQVELLAPGTTVTIGNRQFTTIHTPGHSDGHLVFYDASDRLLLCGDHVLMKITPHIGLWPESEPDPLGRYQASLHGLLALDVRLALPGHGRLITDWQGRLRELQAHHETRLDHMLAAVGSQATLYEVCTRVFNFEQLTPHEMRFAFAETLSHLVLLLSQEKIWRDDSGAIPLYTA